MKLSNLTLAALFIAANLFISCSESKQPAKSMDQIRNEEGLPVTIMEINKGAFSNNISFFSKLEGFKEAVVTSMVGGEVENIHARVGQSVGENQIIISFPTNLPAVQYEQARSALNIAKKTYDRMKNLLESGDIAQQAFDGAETQYNVAKRNFEAVKQMVNVDAPFSGVITDIFVKDGDNVGPGAQLFKIAQLHKIRAKLWVTSKEINQIRPGMPAEFDWNGKTYSGKISEISMALDPMRQAFSVDAIFDNVRKELPSGITVEVKVLTKDNTSSIVIPRNIVSDNADGSHFVFVELNGKAAKRTVVLGEQYGVNVEVLSGLNEGDKIIDCCKNLLEEGKKIKIVDKNI